MNRWQSRDFLIVNAKQSVASILGEFEHCVPQFFIVRDVYGSISAVLNGLEFLQRFDYFQNSRFPGDVDPIYLDVIMVIGKSDDYVLLPYDTERPELTVPFSPPHHILLMDGRTLRAVVGADYLGEWLEASRRQNQSCEVIHLKGL